MTTLESVATFGALPTQRFRYSPKAVYTGHDVPLAELNHRAQDVATRALADAQDDPNLSAEGNRKRHLAALVELHGELKRPLDGCAHALADHRTKVEAHQIKARKALVDGVGGDADLREIRAWIASMPAKDREQLIDQALRDGDAKTLVAFTTFPTAQMRAAMTGKRAPLLDAAIAELMPQLPEDLAARAATADAIEESMARATEMRGRIVERIAAIDAQTARELRKGE